MDCPYCQIAYDPEHWEQCPHCGEENESEEVLEVSGVLRTSTILIASGKGRAEVYRSVADVPEQLRRKLVECTNGQNSGTIYIADQRGREQIALAIHNLPGSAPAPVLDRFSSALVPAASRRKFRLPLSALWIALMILASASAVVWLAGGPRMVAEEVAAGMVVAATVLGQRPFHFDTVVSEWESGPLVFQSPNQIVLFAPVKLQTDQRLWLGEVVECRPEGNGWRTTMRVLHALNHLPELLKLAARFE